VSATVNPLHIMLSSATKLSCGLKTQPWVIEAHTGQQINISLLHFGGSQTSRPLVSEPPQNCQQFGYFVEKSSHRNISLCINNEETESSMVYRSQTNVVEVVLNVAVLDRGSIDSEQPRILIKFHGKDRYF